MATLPQPYVTPAEYLARERAAETKSEYSAGEMFLMGGASREHNLIALNVGSEFRQQFRGRPCVTPPPSPPSRIPPSAGPCTPP